MTTQTDPNPCLAVGKRLVELCEQDKNLQALDELYADDVVSVEVMGMPEVGMDKEMKGIDAIRAKSQWWYDNHEVHGGSCEGPYPHGDRFIVIFGMDITPKMGPNAGQRMQMKEGALYTVKDGKIVREEFFYDMSDCG